MLVSSHAGAAFVIGEVCPFLSDGASLSDDRRVLFENVNVEGMRRRRRMALTHWASCIYLEASSLGVDAQCACQN